ncbi:MAG TPA: TIGR02530 family flagellar biosynthesis protein [Bacillales bacterium]|nr:TIGR02530 family flagellar biosynthesis protein [Bacillales bacterium]
MNHRIQPHLMPTGHPQPKIPRKGPEHKEAFDRVLQQEIGRSEELKISKHAQQRMNERNISIDATQWQSIQSRMTEAGRKGITDSLVVTKNAALVVSMTNNTVVTAMNRQEASSHIFTNINGTILMD